MVHVVRPRSKALYHIVTLLRSSKLLGELERLEKDSILGSWTNMASKTGAVISVARSLPAKKLRTNGIEYQSKRSESMKKVDMEAGLKHYAVAKNFVPPLIS